MKGIIRKRINDGKWVMTYNRVPGRIDMLDILPSDRKALNTYKESEIDGIEMEFEHIDMMDEIGQEWAKFILPKAPVETWEDIYEKFKKDMKGITHGFETLTFLTFLKENYSTPPIKK